MLVQKVNHRVYKIDAFKNKTTLCQDSASYFILKRHVLLARAKLKKRYPHFKKSHFFNDIKYSTETLSIYVFVCLKM